MINSKIKKIKLIIQLNNEREKNRYKNNQVRNKGKEMKQNE